MKTFATLILSLLFTLPTWAEEKTTLTNAVVSCIRVVEAGKNFHDVEPELFFWSELDSQLAKLLIDKGFSLKRSIHSDVLCGSYTPNVEVESRERDEIERAINYHKLLPEDGLKIWTTNIDFEKK